MILRKQVASMVSNKQRDSKKCMAGQYVLQRVVNYYVHYGAIRDPSLILPLSMAKRMSSLLDHNSAQTG